MSQPGDSRQLPMAAYSVSSQSSSQSQLSPFSSPNPTSQPAPRPAPVPVASCQTQVSPIKDASPVVLCRIGQETVQEICVKTVELFSFLRMAQQLPNGMTVTSQKFQELKGKIEDPVHRILVLFQKLRNIYDTLVDMLAINPGPETRPVEEILPIIEVDGSEESVIKKEEEQSPSAEEQDLIEQIRAKNSYLKQIIDQERTLIWEVNTMIAMRKTSV